MDNFKLGQVVICKVRHCNAFDFVAKNSRWVITDRWYHNGIIYFCIRNKELGLEYNKENLETYFETDKQLTLFD